MSAYLDHRGRPRIVITGLGAITPLGNTVGESWHNALEGHSGIGRITQFDPSDFPCQIAGEVKDFDPHRYMPAREARRMARASQLAVAAAQMAVADAGLDSEALPDPERTGVVVGTAMGGFEQADQGMVALRTRGLARVSPFAITSSLCNMPAHHVSASVQALGPLTAPVAACAAGTQGIGEGMELIRRGSADLVLAGGVEGLIIDGAIAGFSAMRALPTNFNDQPEKASRPFDARREGFVYSEGAGIVVLERLDHAVARGARIYAELIGYSSSSDAHHMAIPDPEAEGAIRAMRWAIEDAAVPLTAMDYINAHGSSTPINDAVETLAIKKLFGEHAYNLAVTSTKSIMGHAMGAAGAIESIFTTLALYHSIIPPTWNYEYPDPDCDLDYVPNAPRRAALEVAMNNSFGLGGQNACLVLRRYHNGATG